MFSPYLKWNSIVEDKNLVYAFVVLEDRFWAVLCTQFLSDGRIDFLVLGNRKRSDWSLFFVLSFMAWEN